MGVIYKLTSPSGKSYIGQTKRPIEKRMKEHFKCPGYCIALENAIKKYSDKMEYEVLLEVNDEQLNFYEIRMIQMYDTIEPKGYNIRTGGSVSQHSELSCE